jgi:hypothetical protein
MLLYIFTHTEAKIDGSRLCICGFARSVWNPNRDSCVGRVRRSLGSGNWDPALVTRQPARGRAEPDAARKLAVTCRGRPKAKQKRKKKSMLPPWKVVQSRSPYDRLLVVGGSAAVHLPCLFLPIRIFPNFSCVQ